MNRRTARLLWGAVGLIIAWAVLVRNAMTSGRRAIDPLSGQPLDPGAVGGGGGGFGRPQVL